MRSLSALFRALCILFIALWACGCSGSRIVSVEPIGGPYVLYEQGQLKHFTVIEVYERSWAPGHISGVRYHLLTDGPVPTKDTVRKFEQTLPPRRIILMADYIPNLAPVLVETGGTMSDVANLYSTIKWVIGIDPVIVAVGDRSEKEPQGAIFGGGYFYNGRARVGGNYIFVSEADFHEKVTELIVLEQWPTKFPTLKFGTQDPGGLDATLGVEVKRHLRKIPLPSGMTLGELIKNPSLWAEGAKK